MSPENKFIRFINPEHYLCFKYLYHCIIISLSLLSIIIGINAEIFAQSEQNFFSTIHIQHQILNTPPLIEIDNSTKESNLNNRYKFLYILDRTLSTEMDVKDTAILNDMKNRIKSIHHPDYLINDSILRNLEIKDYALLFMLYWILENHKNATFNNPKFSVAFFDGYKDINIQKLDVNQQIFPVWNTMDTLSYLKIVNNILNNYNQTTEDTKKQWTNYIFICKGIESVVNTLIEGRNSPNEKIILTIISDFIHEEKHKDQDDNILTASFKELETCIKKISGEYAIYQINLIRLPYSVNRISKINYTYLDELSLRKCIDSDIIRLIDLFKSNYTQVYFYEFDLNIENFITKKDGIDYLEKLSVPMLPVPSKEKISFYYPYNHLKSIHTARTRIVFKNGSQPFININDCSNNDFADGFGYNPLNFPAKIEFAKSINALKNRLLNEDTLNAFCYNVEKIKSHELNLEVFEPDKGIKKQYPIVFKQKLPKYYLNLLDVLFTILFESILLFPLIFFIDWRKRNLIKSSNNKIVKIYPVLPCIIIITISTFFLSMWFFGLHGLISKSSLLIYLICLVQTTITVTLYVVHEADNTLSTDIK